MTRSLLDPSFQRRLDQLELETRRITGGQVKGERRSRRKGVSIDFADYRHYARGDDLRFIDWNIYGRLDRLFIKLYHEEQDLQCHLLVDASRSMAFGEPSKIALAKSIAAAIGYVGLAGNDKVSVTCFGTDGTPLLPASRGRHHARRLMEGLDALQTSGETSLQGVCRQFALRAPSRGVVILISDFLDPAGFEPALRMLVRESLDVHLMQVLAPQEIEPTLGGHVELLDMETGHKVELTVNEGVRRAYLANLRAFIAQIQQAALRYGMTYSLIRSDARIEEIMLKRLREAGLVKA